jgi:hypothetical protein
MRVKKGEEKKFKEKGKKKLYDQNPKSKQHKNTRH